MNSSWLLFKTQRWNVLGYGGGCFFVLFLLLFFTESGPWELDLAAGIPFSSLGLAVFLACFARFHTGLFNLPFPVKHRQLAWIPTACLAVLWAAGIAGAFAGIGILSLTHDQAYALPRWTPFILAMLKTFPFAFLIFAVADRLLRSFGVCGLAFMSVVPAFISIDRFESLEHAQAFYQYGWPLCIALGVLFILEAPAHIAALDYPAPVKQGMWNGTGRTVEAPVRTPAIKVWADLIMMLICLVPTIAFYSKLGVFSGLVGVSTFLKVYLAGMGVFIVFGILHTWRGTQANGFTAGKTLVVFLMKCSLVLLPITWALGAKKGTLATCVQCRRHKFLWARHCPHCGHANQGDIAGVFSLTPWNKDEKKPLKQAQVSPRMLYRVMLPILLVPSSIINYAGDFRNERFTLLPSPEGIQTPETAFAEIRVYLASVDDARSWLDSDGDAPLVLPERFRIEVKEYPDWLQVQCYWLQWEDAGAIGERLKERILEASHNAFFTESDQVHKSAYVTARVNRVALPSFLDGGIHWMAQ